ncbi:hypothetical protein ACH5RR_039938 [Cinchona calisaya]|uniref:Secreted protein n=1 Tax=Cinchona calisaya TaxID=153742 RepID=A0ABD2Y4V4_9GENT
MTFFRFILSLKLIFASVLLWRISQGDPSISCWWQISCPSIFFPLIRVDVQFEMLWKSIFSETRSLVTYCHNRPVGSFSLPLVRNNLSGCYFLLIESTNDDVVLCILQ